MSISHVVLQFFQELFNVFFELFYLSPSLLDLQAHFLEAPGVAGHNLRQLTTVKVFCPFLTTCLQGLKMSFMELRWRNPKSHGGWLCWCWEGSRKIYIIFILILLSSCNEYQKLLRSEDIKIKYQKAENYYENGEFRRASGLFEQILPKYRGKPQAERITFFYAKSLLEIKNYVLAAYQFESFVKAYPISQKVEEAAYLEAFCFYKQSPKFSLDQELTVEAIDKLQNFINFYPYSENLNLANDHVQELRVKLEKKSFEIAKQYNTIRDYVSAITVLNSFIIDYPGTPFREDALFYLFDSSYKLAVNSIPSKKLERLNEARKVYEELIGEYPQTQFLNKSESMISDIDKEIAIFAPNQ